jgi:hypothetical protein
LILDGKVVAAKVLEDVRAGVARLRASSGVQPTLAVALVGDFAPSAGQVIRDGDTGFVVSSPNGWFEALDAFASSADLRNRIAGRMRAAMDVEYERQLQQFLEFCAKPLNRGVPLFAETPDVHDEIARLDRFGKPKGAGRFRVVASAFRRKIGV